jgi:transposase
LDAHGLIDWDQWSLDGTIVRAHHAAAGAPHEPVDGPAEPTNHALARSVGGFSTKIHLLVDSTGVPLEAILTPGQTHESTQVETVLEQVAIPRITPHRRRLPHRLAADRAYDAQRIRQYLRQHGITPVIPPHLRAGAGHASSGGARSSRAPAPLVWFTPPRVGALEGGDIELLHLEQRRRHALRLVGLGVPEQLLEDRGDHLP